MEFANKTVLPFEPGLSNPVAVDATGDQYQTPADFREKLGDLARLTYIGTEWSYRVELSGSSAGGTADVILRAGSTDVDSVTIDLSSDTTFTGSRVVDMSDVKGDAGVSVVLNVSGAADAGVTAQVAAKLTVTHPIVIQGRC